MSTMDAIDKEGLRTDLPEFAVGDSVNVVIKVVEGDRERNQIFSGTVIAKKGKGRRCMFTVRKIVQGEGVERVFPLHSPSIATIKVVRQGRVKRSKLYYLRKRVGKATKVKEALLAGDTGEEPAEDIADVPEDAPADGEPASSE